MCEQIPNGGGKVALFGKADAFKAPKAVPVEMRRVAKSVPPAIMSVAPEIPDLLEETTDRDQGVTEGLGASWSSIQQVRRWKSFSRRWAGEGEGAIRN